MNLVRIVLSSSQLELMHAAHRSTHAPVALAASATNDSSNFVGTVKSNILARNAIAVGLAWYDQICVLEVCLLAVNGSLGNAEIYFDSVVHKGAVLMSVDLEIGCY